MEDSKKERLFDSAKRLKEAGSTEQEILQSLKDIGLSEQEAKELTKKLFSGNNASLQGEAISPQEQKTNVSEQFHSSNDSFLKKVQSNFFGKKQGSKKTEEKKPSVEEKKDLPAEKDGSKKTELDNAREFTDQPGEVKFREVLPIRVSDFDKLIKRGGLKRGDTILLSGGCGTGKTTFGMQSIYYGALNGEKGIYITLEESTEKIRENMIENFGWDLAAMEKKGLIALIKVDPLKIARSVEAALVQKRGGLYIEGAQFDLGTQFSIPFNPDRVVFDSLSALSIAFQENDQGYRQYLRQLFSTLESYGSINIVLGETEQVPGVYSRSGIEEFLADGVIVFYNIKIHNLRQKALEILKLRSSNHEKRIVPFQITNKGMEIYVDENLFKEVE